jgi:hypothetical protein
MQLFPRINNRNNFLVKNHPIYHPASINYIDYWREQKKRCIEGYWAEDTTKEEHQKGIKLYRFMPPALYFYVNMATIKIINEKEKNTVLRRPNLDDVEWIAFTVLLVCRGFSGFELDTEYTCITDPEKRPEGKTYIDPWEYLKQRHEKPLGVPLYENNCLNLLWLTSRGLGKTFIAGALAGHEILIDGAKRYTQQSIDNPASITVFVGAFKADKSINLLSTIDDLRDNLPGSYGKGDEFTPSPLYKELSGVNKPGIIREHIYKVKEGGSWKDAGSGSKLVHELVTVSNPQAPAAYRATMAIIEEIGLLEADIQAVLGATGPTLKIGSHKIGSFIGIGTGGNITKVAQLESIFRNPREYEFFAMEDIFERTGEIGLFMPTHYMYREYKDENGNTDWEKTEQVVSKIRAAKKYQALEQEKMNYPIVPSEIFMNSGGSIFPQEEIKNQLRWVIANETKLNNILNVGMLHYSDNGIVFRKDSNLTPINKYPVEKGTNLAGAITIFEHPPEYIPEGMFKIVYDPYRDDNIEKMDRGVSCASIYVYKAVQQFDGVHDQLVAWYVGRLRNVDDVHDIAIKMATYYKAKIMVEMDLPGFYKYCIHNRKVGFLARTPWVTMGKFNPKGKKRIDYGIMMKGNGLLKIQAEQYISRWLLQERKKYYDDEGNEVGVQRNVDCVYDRGLLEELLNYNRTGNFDRISSLFLLMIWLEETKEIPVTNTIKSKQGTFDEFFSKYFKQ